MGSFSDMVGSWAKATPQRLNAVFARSIELLADEMTTTRGNGGRLPFKTGNLARSLLASTAGPVKVGGKDEKYSGSNVGLVTAGVTLQDEVHLGYQAIYSRRMNFGYTGPDSLGRMFNFEGFHFVEAAVADWPIIVQLAAEDVEANSRR